jgi:hypothetical protein
MSLSKEHRCVYANHSGRLKRSFVEFPPSLLQAARHGTRIADKKMAAFRRDDRPGIAVKELLPKRILHLMDDTRYLRGRYSFPPCHHREILRFINVYKNQQGTYADVPGLIH